MAVSALIVTIDEGCDATLRAIADDRRFTLGPRQGERVALVLDTPAATDDEAAFEWLRARPGVEAVDVVAVYLDPTPPEEGP